MDVLAYDSMVTSNQFLVSNKHPVAIFWDIENCRVPTGIMPEDVAGNIRMALALHPMLRGPVTHFSAYGDFNKFSRRLREGCQKTGINLIDVPNGRKDAADKAILVDMFMFALDNPPPSTIFLISGDVDFSVALHKLKHRNFITGLAVPFRANVSSALWKASQIIFDWPSLAQGQLVTVCFEGPVLYQYPPYHALDAGKPSFRIEDDTADCYIEHPNNSRGFCASTEGTISIPYAQSSDQTVKTLPQKKKKVTFLLPSTTKPMQELLAPPNETNTATELHGLMERGDLPDLGIELVNLLQVYGGRLLLSRVETEYQKAFGKRLPVPKDGSLQLTDLIHSMNDILTVEVRGSECYLCLKENISLLIKDMNSVIAKEQKPEKKALTGRVQEVTEEDVANLLQEHCNTLDSNINIDATIGDDTFNEKRAMKQDEANKSVLLSKDKNAAEGQVQTNLEIFKEELQILLVTHACRIVLRHFLALYRHKFSKELDFRVFGVNSLEELIEKTKDIAIIIEERATKIKLIVAACEFK